MHQQYMPRPRAAGIRIFDQFQKLSESSWQFDWYFDAQDPAFTGHFPHQKILPGVFLIEMAQRAAEFALTQTCGQRIFLNRIDSFRFLQSVLPGDACVLVLAWDALSAPGAAVAVRASFSKPGGRVAHGLLRVAVPAPLDEARHAH